MSSTKRMRAVQIQEPHGAFEVVDRPVPEPGPDDVRVAVDACGVCRGDVHVREANPAVDYPRIPGHEVVGTVDRVGAEVTEWTVGNRVGVGWHGGHCSHCRPCNRGNPLLCAESTVTGMHRDGGYAEYAVADRDALVGVPDGLSSTAAAPLLCAGLTSFNALRNADVELGDCVAVVGIGGLGHLALQYARAAGFETVAVSRGTEKREDALHFGADHYVDSEDADVAEALRALGGADLVFATAPSSAAVEDALGGLAPNGEVVAVGVPDSPVSVEVGQLTGTRGSLSGWASGSPQDAEDTLAFSALRDVAPEVEAFDLENAETAYQRMLSSDARFRAVLMP